MENALTIPTEDDDDGKDEMDTKLTLIDWCKALTLRIDDSSPQSAYLVKHPIIVMIVIPRGVVGVCVFVKQEIDSCSSVVIKLSLSLSNCFILV